MTFKERKKDDLIYEIMAEIKQIREENEDKLIQEVKKNLNIKKYEI